MCLRSGLLLELLQEALEARREEQESGGTSHKVCGTMAPMHATLCLPC